jgi:putative flippase GtrA
LENFLKFAVTGGLGTVTNLLLFSFMVDVFDLPALLASTLCYLLAATQNYFLNYFWVFQGKTGSSCPSFRLWRIFLMGSLAGLGVNLIILQLTLGWFSAAVYSQLLGIGAGFVVNFFMTKFFVFKH